MIDFLLTRFTENRLREAIIWEDRAYNYAWLLDRIDYTRQLVERSSISRGAVVSIQADFSPASVAIFLVLVERGCILVPLTSSVSTHHEKFTKISQAEFAVTVDGEDQVQILRLGQDADHPFYARLKTLDHPGLVLFSSGSTGQSKAAVHDLAALLDKFRTPRHTLRTISFLLYDHIGGVNTMLYILSNAGCMVTVKERTPETVLASIEKHRVELLPTSPTFVNLLLLSEAWRRHDLTSLQTVTYGTEPMQESTLKRFHQLFPNIKLLQTYGLSEVGILRSQSKSSDSLWVRVGGEGFETRVVEGIFQIKAKSAMLGYLNAPSPFTDDGWFITGDLVEVDGDYVRFLGRKSEIINVGGEKVYPAEVESVLQEMEGVAEASIVGEPNPIIGKMVVAKVQLTSNENAAEFRKRMHTFCSTRLARYKIPQKVIILDQSLAGGRFKKMRNEGGNA